MKKITRLLTKKNFCHTYQDMAKMRRNDPIQFNVAFNDWRRSVLARKFLKTNINKT